MNWSDDDLGLNYDEPDFDDTDLMNQLLAELLTIDQPDLSRSKVMKVIGCPTHSPREDEIALQICLVHATRHRIDFDLVNRCPLEDHLKRGVLEELVSKKYGATLAILGELIVEGKITTIRSDLVLFTISRKLWGGHGLIKSDHVSVTLLPWFRAELLRLARLAATSDHDPLAIDAADTLKQQAWIAIHFSSAQAIRWLHDLLPGDSEHTTLFGTRAGDLTIPISCVQSANVRDEALVWLMRQGYRLPGRVTKRLLINAIRQNRSEAFEVILAQWRANPQFEMYGVFQAILPQGMVPGEHRPLPPQDYLLIAQLDPSFCSVIHDYPIDVIRSIIRAGAFEQLRPILDYYTATNKQASIQLDPIEIHDFSYSILTSLIDAVHDFDQRATVVGIFQEYMLEHDTPIQYRVSDQLVIVSHSPSLTPLQRMIYEIPGDRSITIKTEINGIPIQCICLDQSRRVSLSQIHATCQNLFAKSAKSAMSW